MSIYAKIGESFQQIGGDCPDGFIEMKTKRPDGFYIATESGDWMEDLQAEHDQFRRQRAKAVANIKVEVDGLLFDGDEISQSRMARAVTISTSDTNTILWVLADNTPAQVTAAQLRKALRLAGEEQARLWIPEN